MIKYFTLLLILLPGCFSLNQIGCPVEAREHFIAPRNGISYMAIEARCEDCSIRHGMVEAHVGQSPLNAAIEVCDRS